MAIATGLAEPYCYNRDLIKRRTIENENAPIVLESATGNVQVGEIKFMSLNVLGYMYTTLLHDTFYLRVSLLWAMNEVRIILLS